MIKTIRENVCYGKKLNIGGGRKRTIQEDKCSTPTLCPCLSPSLSLQQKGSALQQQPGGQHWS